MILIVDDNADSRTALAMLLELDGFHVLTASCGADALELLGTIIPHCVVLDYHMPGMSGLEVLERIRADVRWAKIRVILFSGGGPDLKEMAMQAGADAYVEKGSLDFGDLRRAFERFCSPEGVPRQPKPPGPPQVRNVS